MNLKVIAPKNPAQPGAILNCLLNPRHTPSGTVRLPTRMESEGCHVETTGLPQYIRHLLLKKITPLATGAEHQATHSSSDC